MTRLDSRMLVAALATLLALTSAPLEAQFTYTAAGTLSPTTSGRGRVDTHLYAAGMRFPIQNAPAYANSQVYGHGGASGPGGGQCDSANYSYPWHDNYCETRSWTMPLCPSGRGHQGQDIRPATCRAGVNPAVAAASGTITSVGSYSVYLTAADGTRYDYLHMSSVRVRKGQKVSCGDVLGLVSNVFGSTTTTIHLHFNMRQAVRGVGSVFVPPYSSLVDAYQRLLAGQTTCGGSVDAGPVDAASFDGGAASGASCRSSTLNATVPSGECVQVGAGVEQCGASGCAVSQCVNGAWTCPSSTSACTTVHSNAACTSSSGASCHSATLGTDVESGSCVQTPGASCGQTSCSWFLCTNGSWSCSSLEFCAGSRSASAQCADACVASGRACESASDCCSGLTCSDQGLCETPSDCSTTRASCSSSNDCCDSLVCQSSACCALPPSACATSADCCAGLECLSGRCACRARGLSCTRTEECCGSDVCSGGVCAAPS